MASIPTPGRLVFALATSFSLCNLPVLAQTSWSSSPQTDTSTQTAQAHREANLKLCASEASQGARLKCRRSVQAAYDKALAGQTTQGIYATQPAEITCPECGRVVAVTINEKPGDSAMAGAVAGGSAGASLPDQLGSGGVGKDLTVVANAAHKAAIGKKIGEVLSASKVWTVKVQYPHGGSASYDFSEDPSLIVGDSVKDAGNTVLRH